MRILLLTLLPLLASPFLAPLPQTPHQSSLHSTESDPDNEPPVLTGDWRKFRDSLRTLSPSSKPLSSPPVTTPANLALLYAQNPPLHTSLLTSLATDPWPVYRTGIPEPTNLLLSLPYASQIWTTGRLATRRSSPPEPLYAAALTRIENMLFVEGEKGSGVDEDMKKTVSAAVKNTDVWYKATNGAIEDFLTNLSLTTGAETVSLDRLSATQKEVLLSYVDAEEHWEEVALVLDEETVVNVHRPLSFGIERPLARSLLRKKEASAEEPLVERFVKVFGKDGCVYSGGEANKDVVRAVHGFDGVGVEVGKGIWVSDASAVLDYCESNAGTAGFVKFVVGESTFGENVLRNKCERGEYASLEVPAGIVLKQCKALPVPLWHECCRLAGGELLEVSKIELVKRGDITE